MIELAAVENGKRKYKQFLALDGTYEPGYILHFVGNLSIEKSSYVWTGVWIPEVCSKYNIVNLYWWRNILGH
jgi:hypothetical protein